MPACAVRRYAAIKPYVERIAGTTQTGYWRTTVATLKDDRTKMCSIICTSFANESRPSKKTGHYLEARVNPFSPAGSVTKDTHFIRKSDKFQRKWWQRQKSARARHLLNYPLALYVCCPMSDDDDGTVRWARLTTRTERAVPFHIVQGTACVRYVTRSSRTCGLRFEPWPIFPLLWAARTLTDQPQNQTRNRKRSECGGNARLAAQKKDAPAATTKDTGWVVIRASWLSRWSRKCQIATRFWLIR